MKLTIKLIDDTLPVPQYHTEGSVAFDLYARKQVYIEPFTPVVIPLNIIVKIPKGFVLLVALRSSVPLKKDLLIPNGVGVIDQDYRGDNDEIGLEVISVLKKEIIVERGERIAQAMIIPIKKVSTFDVVTKMGGKSRGGFGSTGR